MFRDSKVSGCLGIRNGELVLVSGAIIKPSLIKPGIFFSKFKKPSASDYEISLSNHSCKLEGKSPQGYVVEDSGEESSLPSIKAFIL